ncbi:MAG TPA: hypothetical protein VF189_05675 [Patescibacteria group bacterium]
MKFLLSLLLALGIIFLFPISSFAAEKTQVTVLPKNEVINHDYFATGSNVDIEGTVNGDVYAAGASILINGTINGDVLATGGQVTISGNVRNVRVAGGQILIDGRVLGNVTALGGNIQTTQSSDIQGSLVGAGGQFSLLGPIGKSLSLATGQTTIGNRVGNDIWMSGGQITITNKSQVNGNVAYISNQNATIENGATISGKVTHSYPPAREINESQRNVSSGLFGLFAGIKVTLGILGLFMSIIVGLLLIYLTPTYTSRVIDQITKHPWKSLVIGIVGWIVGSIMLFLLFMTIIGIPFSILGIFVLITLSYVGKIFGALIVGRWLLSKLGYKSLILALIVGIIVIEISSFVPILGWIFGYVISAIGFGAVIFMKKVYYSEFKAKKVI